ncbi:hypothetical protein BCR42DRAFT_452305 [Absidia repens]|uniref:EF-hand n=1 Tax=Absidia repens TaxID=90262 RepID=A0A1X2IEW9_9FUNG|nr:hypothetical protein BCR42DRAFT_452305 [Absidia repens]
MPRFSPFLIVVSGIVTGVGVIVTVRYTLKYKRREEVDAQQQQQRQQQRRRSTTRRRQGISAQQRRRQRRISTRNGQQQQQQNRRRSSLEEEHDDWLLPLHLDSDNDRDADTLTRSDNIDDGDDSDGVDDTSELHIEAPSYPNEQTDRLLSLFTEWQEDDDSDNKNLLQLLHSISENQARKEGYIHRGITCNKCAVSPIRGIRYKCANCVDFDLCDMCEASNKHTHTHVFLKIRIPIPPLANPRSALLPPFYPGKNDSLVLTADQARELESSSHFDQVELEALFAQYKSLSVVESTHGGINQTTFDQCLGPLGMEKNLITERIFAFFDRDRDGIITFPELVNGLSVLCKGNLDEKIEYAFNGYDLDEDGYISREELYWMFKSYFYLSMELVRDVVSAMEDDMMDNYEFPAGQPVSAAFNVPIPSAATSDGGDDSNNSSNSDNDNDNDDDDDDIANRGSYTSAIPSTSTQPRASSTNAHLYPQKHDYFKTLYTHSNDDDKDPTSPSAGTAIGLTEDHGQLLDDSLPEQDNNTRRTGKAARKEPTKQQWEEKFPIMETMAQDAIHEMVNKTFRNMVTQREGYISFEEFKQCVQTDSSIVSWFEALGTVF